MEFLEKIKYHITLANYFAGKPLYLDEPTQKKPNVRKLVEQPWQQTKAELWNEVTNTLCDLDFIQAIAVVAMTFELIKDFNFVLVEIPDNAEFLREENEHLARMDKYTRDLVAYAKGEIAMLEIPECIVTWSQGKTDALTKQVKINSSRLDRLKDFLNFLGQEAGNLQKYSHEFQNFAIQQAWNYASCGPVSETAGNSTPFILNKLLLRSTLTRPPWAPIPQSLKTLNGHTSSVNSVATKPDGKRAISGSKDYTWILWDLSTGLAIKTSEKIRNGHNNAINSVAITPDGKRAISGSEDQTCIIWNMETGHMIYQLFSHTRTVSSVAIAPDGRRAISCSGTEMYDSDRYIAFEKWVKKKSQKYSNPYDIYICIIWDLNKGKSIHLLKGHTNCVTSVAITPDGKRAITVSFDRNYILWNLVTGKSVTSWKGNDSIIRTIAITPDGQKAISRYEDNTCVIWNLKSGQPIKNLSRDIVFGETIVFTPDGKKLISSYDDKTCIIYDFEKEKKMGVFVTNSSIRAVSCFPSGVFMGTDSGHTFILNVSRELLCPDGGIITIRQIWDYDLQKYLKPSADCPMCGHRFEPPANILGTIEKITKKVGLKSHQSPCLELPDEAWENPDLLSNCPQCGGGLKFNPFIAGDY